MVGNLECLGFYSAHVTHPCPQLKISSVDSASNKAVTIIFDNDFTLDGDRVNGADCLGVYFGVKRVATCYISNRLTGVNLGKAINVGVYWDDESAKTVSRRI
jgi:hypothetical protein